MITRGSLRGRRGFIYGDLARQHPLATKALVILGKRDVAVPLADLAADRPCGAQLELELRTNEKGPAAGARGADGGASSRRLQAARRGPGLSRRPKAADP